MSDVTITVRWGADDQGHVRFSKGFEQSSAILQADMLKDAIWELQQKYSERLEKGLYENDNQTDENDNQPAA